MNKEELWHIYVRNNPVFAAEDMTKVQITARGMRKLFEQTWDIAYRAGVAKATAEKSLFEKIMGNIGKATGCILVVVLLAGCIPEPQPQPHEAPLNVAPPPVEGERFVVQIVQKFRDDFAYEDVRAVYLITDVETGRKYLGVSGIGISELGSHSDGEDTVRDER